MSDAPANPASAPAFPEKKPRKPCGLHKPGLKPTPERALAVLSSIGSGKFNHDVSRITGLPDKPSKAVGKAALLTLAEYSEMFRTQAQEIVEIGLARMRETLPDASIGQATLAVGVLSDKLHQARPKSGDVHLHLHSSQDRNALLGSLLGTAQLNRDTHKEKLVHELQKEQEATPAKPDAPEPVSAPDETLTKGDSGMVEGFLHL